MYQSTMTASKSSAKNLGQQRGRNCTAPYHGEDCCTGNQPHVLLSGPFTRSFCRALFPVTRIHASPPLCLFPGGKVFAHICAPYWQLPYQPGKKRALFPATSQYDTHFSKHRSSLPENTPLRAGKSPVSASRKQSTCNDTGVAGNEGSRRDGVNHGPAHRESCTDFAPERGASLDCPAASAKHRFIPTDGPGRGRRGTGPEGMEMRGCGKNSRKIAGRRRCSARPQGKEGEFSRQDPESHHPAGLLSVALSAPIFMARGLVWSRRIETGELMLCRSLRHEGKGRRPAEGCGSRSTDWGVRSGKFREQGHAPAAPCVSRSARGQNHPPPLNPRLGEKLGETP